jgi:hypothetical protein
MSCNGQDGWATYSEYDQKLRYGIINYERTGVQYDDWFRVYRWLPGPTYTQAGGFGSVYLYNHVSLPGNKSAITPNSATNLVIWFYDFATNTASNASTGGIHYSPLGMSQDGTLLYVSTRTAAHADRGKIHVWDAVTRTRTAVNISAHSAAIYEIRNSWP